MHVAVVADDVAAEAPQSKPSARFRTRWRLLAVVATVAAMLLVAVALQYMALRGIEQERAAAEEMEERLLAVMQLESALRRQFAHQPHLATGNPVHVAAYREARSSIATLTGSLAKSLEQPEAIAAVGAIATATGELERLARLSGPARNDAAEVERRSARTSALLVDIEQNVDLLFSLLKAATESHREIVSRGHGAILRLAIALVLGTAMLTVLFTLYLSRSVATPLARLEQGVARIAGGNLDARIDIRTRDEFGAVASQLNTVAARLQEHRERLTRAEALAAVGRSTAAVVHELNNSLQVMLGYATLDRDTVAGELSNHLQRIEHEARRSTEIVSGVLAMSRSSEGVAFAPVDVREVADEVASSLRLLLPKEGPEIAVSGSGVALGTRCRFHQILSNLAKNAADAAGSGGKVRITVSETTSATTVTVDDDGPGVPPQLAARIFEPFFTTKAGGTGLGLAVTRTLAEVLGGTLEVGRSDLGGARFQLRIPRKKGEV